MRVSIEQVLLTDFAANLFLMTFALRGRYRVRLTRLLSAAFAGSAFGALVRLSGISGRYAGLMCLGFLPVLSAAACGRFLFGAGIRLFAAASAFSVLMRLIPERMALPVILGCSILLLFPLRDQRGIWTREFALEVGGHAVRFTALVDTGNRLREPVSALPVLLAEERLLKPVLPGIPESSFRTVYYGGVGGEGALRCFFPEKLLMRSGKKMRQTCDLWVAVYPGTLPGRRRALAPPETLD